MSFFKITFTVGFLCCAHLVMGQVDTLEVLFRNSFEVFQSLRNDKGVYRDSKVFEGADFHPSSVAATGMGLISLCVADAMGWIDDAEAQAIQTLETMTGKTPGFTPDRNMNGYYRHWIDMDTGARAWDSEYSTIDTGIFFAGALFAYKYFCANGDNQFVLDYLFGTEYDGQAAMDDPILGTIFREMNADGTGVSSALTLPFNEYMLAAWLSDPYVDYSHKGMELWFNHYRDVDSLTTNNFNGIPLLTDNPNGYLSSFVIQFNYYLVHDFTIDDGYLQFMENARLADSTWWSMENAGSSYQWGLGAGSANYGSGYHADKINENQSHIYSPHIIAGFLPVSPKDTVYLKQQYANGSNLYTLPGSNGAQVLWRKSLDDPNYKANEIQGVDYSTMLFGLATLDRFLGKDFFATYNDFYTPPCSWLNSSVTDERPVQDLFLAYPNPISKEELTIEFENEYRGRLLIEVYDVNGQKQMSATTEKIGEVLKYNIDVRNWSHRLYIITMKGRGINASAKVIRD